MKQNYFEHGKDSLYYSYISGKASFYFLIHALYPDVYLTNGSKTINDLNATIMQKYFSTKYNKVNK